MIAIFFRCDPALYKVTLVSTLVAKSKNPFFLVLTTFFCDFLYYITNVTNVTIVWKYKKEGRFACAKLVYMKVGFSIFLVISKKPLLFLGSSEISACNELLIVTKSVGYGWILMVSAFAAGRYRLFVPFMGQ